jgi:hypothetical protein
VHWLYCVCVQSHSLQYSRDVLKVDFRTGLRDLDESAALERDPNSFDPTVALRDYDAIDLPVYCVSARDYARIHSKSAILQVCAPLLTALVGRVEPRRW